MHTVAQPTTNVNQTPAHIIAARAAGLMPYMCGVLDAAAKRPCQPDDYIMDGDREAYNEGYAVQADEMLAAERFGLMLAAMLGGEHLALFLVEAAR